MFGRRAGARRTHALVAAILVRGFRQGHGKGSGSAQRRQAFLAPRFAEFCPTPILPICSRYARFERKSLRRGRFEREGLRLDANGKATTVFESPELAAQTLALDASGNLFVGTSPDGKVYKVTPAGQSSVFFDPKTKYIWDLAVDKDGTVYVATGDTGKIFAVAPDGKGQVFYPARKRTFGRWRSIRAATSWQALNPAG